MSLLIFGVFCSIFNPIIILVTLVVLRVVYLKDFGATPYTDDIDLFHYITKSKEEFLKRDTCPCGRLKDLEIFLKYDKNEVVDKRAIEIAKKLKNKSAYKSMISS